MKSVEWIFICLILFFYIIQDIIIYKTKINGGFMQFFYATMWIIVGLILIFSISKENKIFYFAGGYFLFLGAWWLIDALNQNVNMFAGGYKIALGIVTFIALVVLMVYYIRYHIRRTKDKNEESDSK